MMSLRDSFGDNLTVGVVGASGGIGGAFVDLLQADPAVSVIHAFSRTAPVSRGKLRGHQLDLTDEATIEEAAATLQESRPLSLCLITSGILHRDGPDGFGPEKANRQLDPRVLAANMAINAAGPALVMKHFIPLLPKDQKSVIAALSARVGSISDNRLGGWHSYRASKAALNMLIRTMSIELARTKKQAILMGLHPGTVDTRLSEPFQGNVPDGKLFTPTYSASQMLDVVRRATPADSGWCFDYAGEKVPS